MDIHGKGTVDDNFDLFLKKITIYYEESIKDSFCKKLLGKMKTTTNSSKDIEFFLECTLLLFFLDERNALAIILLNSILKPVGTFVMDKKKSKYTIQDGMDSILISISEINEMQTKIEELSKESYAIKKTLQPFLISINFEKFYIIINRQILYKFLNFNEAFDVLFKTFFVFNIKFPKASTLMYIFIQKHFFNIDFDQPTLIHRGKVNTFFALL